MPCKWQQWYSHDINAWNASATIQCFTDAAYRAFHNLIMAQFESDDGMLDIKKLAKLSRMGVRWNEDRPGLPTIAEEVMEEFQAGPEGKVFNERMYSERERSRELFEKRSKGGKSKPELNSDERVLEESSNTLERVLEETGTHIPVPIPIQEQKLKATPRKSAAVIPEWIPKDSWDGFVEMRKRIRAPLTDRAITETIRDLEKLAKLGHDPGKVLDQSTQRSWRGIFELKGENNAGNKPNFFGTKADRNREAAKQAIASILGDDLDGICGVEASDHRAGSAEGIRQAPVVLPPERRQ